MKYTPKNIKKFKSQLVKMSYNISNGYKHLQTGVITATTPINVLFLVNNEGENPIELKLKYDQITVIEVCKRKAKIEGE